MANCRSLLLGLSLLSCAIVRLFMDPQGGINW